MRQAAATPTSQCFRESSWVLTPKCGLEVSLPEPAGRVHDHQELRFLSSRFTPPRSSTAVSAPALLHAFQPEGRKRGMLKGISPPFMDIPVGSST